MKLTKIGSIGVSGMMHGYLPFNSAGELLAPFRTWRNNLQGPAADELTKVLNFNIPQRWSIAHIYQAILNGEEHVKDIAHFTTLAGYIHWKLSGEKVLGVGEASGMFPIDESTGCYDKAMLEKFAALENVKKYDWKIEEILPAVLPWQGRAELVLFIRTCPLRPRLRKWIRLSVQSTELSRTHFIYHRIIH